MRLLGSLRKQQEFALFWKELNWLSLVLVTLGALAAPGLIAKMTGAVIETARVGADPAIQVGTVIFQTAPVTLAVAVLAVGFPRLMERLEDERGPSWLSRWPLDPLIPWAIVTSVLVTTTAGANALGMNSGVDLAAAWDEHPAPTFPLLAELVGMYLNAYGFAAFASAVVVGAFLARWYKKAARALAAQRTAGNGHFRVLAPSVEEVLQGEEVRESARARGGSLYATNTKLLFVNENSGGWMEVPYAVVRWAEISGHRGAKQLRLETLDGDNLSFDRVSPADSAERLCELLNRRVAALDP